MNTYIKNYQHHSTEGILNAEEILTKEAQEFLYELHKNFNDKRLKLLENRSIQQKKFDAGDSPDFLEETQNIRNSDFVAASIPTYLQDRRVEITGPVDRKMIINALNSGASCFMADFEDSNSPTWSNCLEGQVNLRDAVNQTISFTQESNEKHYSLNDKLATLLVRPRGLHLNEGHFLVEDEPISASLFDFGLFFFHNAKNQITKGFGPAFYLPKLEHYQEAAWWNDVFVFAQNYLEIPQGTIKATVLIETITASFQLDEIIFALKEHIAGLNCGRWDYIFSYIKKLKNHDGFTVPDRDQVTMLSPFMNSYSKNVIKICHKRKIHAIGGMAAQIPISKDEEANEIALDKVRKDKLREVTEGHDGTWVAHPALVPVAKEIFDRFMPQKNQIDHQLNDFEVSQQDLLEIPKGEITENGIRKNINVALLYIESWLQGVGAAALYHLMEDAATAEISRTQLWQWLHNQAITDQGKSFDATWYEILKQEELQKIKEYRGEEYFTNGKFETATQLLDQLVLNEEFEEFLTLPAYQFIF